MGARLFRSDATAVARSRYSPLRFVLESARVCLGLSSATIYFVLALLAAALGGPDPRTLDQRVVPSWLLSQGLRLEEAVTLAELSVAPTLLDLPVASLLLGGTFLAWSTSGGFRLSEFHHVTRLCSSPKSPRDLTSFRALRLLQRSRRIFLYSTDQPISSQTGSPASATLTLVSVVPSSAARRDRRYSGNTGSRTVDPLTPAPASSPRSPAILREDDSHVLVIVLGFRRRLFPS